MFSTIIARPTGYHLLQAGHCMEIQLLPIPVCRLPIVMRIGNAVVVPFGLEDAQILERPEDEKLRMITQLPVLQDLQLHKGEYDAGSAVKPEV